ncbi:MAG: hypothetical protein K2N48_08830, partial [Muribaculaceae bacterium]|nr:hypothetical protein [Muribaculaceae bacterium]
VYQSRIYLTGKVAPAPNYDYEHVFPITLYEAIRRSEDEHSATLLDELNSIYRLIKTKQDIIEAGIAGRIMTWTGVRGQIGSMEVVRSIAADPINRSHAKIPSVRAIGDLLDSKMSRKDFNDHVLNSGIHVTDDEKERWNSMAPLSSLNLHIQNEMVHVTGAEKKAWNAKADGAEFAKHVTDTDNPHNTTAHQVGTYSRREIDDLFANLRESFFTYLNIVWDTQINVATLEEYDPDNWNPNFILEYGDSLPEVSDPAGTYFALIPATDNKTNETQDCIIYIKLPGMTWQEVGFQSMKPGDMVIKYPEALMYVWVQGKFTPLFAKDGSSGGTTDPVPGTSNILWKPYIDDNGELAWKLATADDPPETMVIRGYTPQKGVDYFDGKDGEGVPKGGIEHDILVKSSDNDYDTEWKDLLTMLREFVDRGGVIPKDGVVWENIKGAPKQYDELGENIDGYMTQKSVTDAINGILDKIQAILDLGDIAAMQQSINAHLMDYQNPHHVAPDQIGAVSIAAFVGHTQNFDNPHLVTAAQLGLGSVDNTRDIDKPISNEMQHALDELWAKINSLGVITPIDPEDPDAPVLPAFRYVSDVKFTDNVIHILFSDKAELNVELPEPIINNPVEKIFCSARFDRETNELVIIREDESEDRFSLVTLVQVLTGSKGDQINIDVTDDNRIIATLKLDSVTGDHLIQDIHLRGNPTTTTQDVTDKSTRLATTEWVKGQVIDNLISYEVDRPLSANMGRILNQRKADITDVIKLIEDIEGIDIIDDLESTSPVAALSANMGRHLDLTKAPRVHTSPSGSTFGQATKDVFGHVRSANEDPLMDGLVYRGEADGSYAGQ